ncbi:MAG: hypothetical protein HY247_03130 [archaeon]|nr:MAG: hypothetical protein HY247_03130 [archaeon]
MATIQELFEVIPQGPQSRRSSMEILCDILEVVSSGMEKPTHIIYKANISWKVLNNSLKTLLSNGLVFRSNEGKRDVYKLTDKGYAALGLYKDLKTRLAHSEGVLPSHTFHHVF